MPRCPTVPAATDAERGHVMLAPAPNESGIYPIGVFSDVETTWSGDEVDDALREFSELGARLRSRYVQR
jgi:hypothetical protein